MGEDKNSTDESFIESVKQVLYSRIKSRFTGAFVLSWFVSNWQIFYFTIFVSQTEINTTKLDYVTKHFLDYSHILWWPLGGAFVITLIAPLINGLANNWNEYSSLVIKSISLKIAKKTPVDRLEYESLIEKFNEFEILKIREIQKLKDDFSEERQRLEASINNLSEENDVLKKQIISLNQTNLHTNLNPNSISDERILKRLKIELKTVLNEELVKMAQNIGPFVNSDNEIEKTNLLFKEFDLLKANFYNILITKKIAETANIIDFLKKQIFSYEDNITDLIESLKSKQSITTKDRLNQLRELFEPLNSSIDSINKELVY